MGITHNLPGAIAKIRSLWDRLKLILSSVDSPDLIRPSDKDLMLRSNQIEVGLKSTRYNN